MESLTIRSRSQDAVALWTKRITECKNSEMLAGDWCAENGINEAPKMAAGEEDWITAVLPESAPDSCKAGKN